jgi:single-strand DNA-binding protein
MGRCVETPELRHTQNGVSVTSFTIAVDRSYTPKGQDKQTDFLTIVGWRGTAEFCAKYFTKGQLIAVQGSIQTRNYTDKDGNKRKAFEIVADQVHFAEPKRDSSNKNTYEPASNSPDVSAGNDDFEEVPSDDDLPF